MSEHMRECMLRQGSNSATGWRGRVAAGCGIVGLVATIAGCIGDPGAAPSVRSPSAALGRVHATPINAIMAVGETLQIGVHAQSLTGEPITAFDSVLYILSNITDTSRVDVSSTGMVTAKAESGSDPVYVNVVVFAAGLARADQVVLQVTPTAIAGATLSIQPGPGESTMLAQNDSKTIVPVVGNATTGEYVSDPQFQFLYHDDDAAKMVCSVPSFPNVGTISGVQLAGTFCQTQVGLDQIRAQVRADSVWVIAAATIYGVPMRDSVKYYLTNQSSAYVFVQANNLAVGGGDALEGPIYLSAGGVIYFYNLFDPQFATSVDFILDDPSAATADDPPASVGDSTGNVIGLQGQEYSSRRFLTAGTYPYTATVHTSVEPFGGAVVHGQIIVQ